MTRSAAKLTQRRSSRERLRESAKALFAELGYESASTAAIARGAGTSESQLVKHFTDKQGVLEAIFEHAWSQINPAIRLATESIESPREKLRMLFEMTLGFLEKDHAMRTLFLLEGRRIRGDGHMVVLVPGFLEFVQIVDGILKAVADQGQLAGGMNAQAFRSGLMGAVEGMLRDQMLSRSSAKTAKLPASYTDADVRAAFSAFVASGMKQP